MSRREAVFCDMCGKEIRSNHDHFKFNLESGRYADAAGEIDTDIVNFDFCRGCAQRFVSSLNYWIKHPKHLNQEEEEDE